jgi:hypothetical protein
VKFLLAVLCLLTNATAQAASPSEAALTYLGELQETTANWSERTAVFPGTTAEKRLIILERLKLLANELKQGKLSVIDEKTDGDLSAVIVSQIVGADPNQIQVHALGMIRRDEAWLPAPVLASFENTGVRYQPELGESAKRLETWMLTERNRQLARLSEDMLSGLLDDIRECKTKKELKDTPPAELVTGFISACQELNIPLALAYLGGLDDPLPEDWRNTVSHTSNALHTPWQEAGPWRELSNLGTLHAALETETDGNHASVTLGLFNPSRSRPGPTEWSVRHFSLQKSEQGLWRIDLPIWLLQGDEDFHNALIDEKLYAEFPKRIIEDSARGAFATPSALVDSFLASLMNKQFAMVLPHLSRYIGKEESAAMLAQSSRLWRRFSPDDKHPLRLAIHTMGDVAWAIYTSFDPQRPDIPGSSQFYLQLEKDDFGWSIAGTADADEAEDVPAEIQAWLRQIEAMDEDEWLAELGLDQRLGGLAAAPAPEEAVTRTVAEAWIEALKSSAPRDIFPTITGFDDKSAIRHIFSFLGQELSTPTQYELLGVHRHGRWAGVTIRHRTTEDEPTEHLLLHPIVVTPGGPRVLPEAILYQANTRAQRYLNESVWKRLRKRLPEEAVAELEALYQKHEKHCETLTENE